MWVSLGGHALFEASEKNQGTQDLRNQEIIEEESSFLFSSNVPIKCEREKPCRKQWSWAVAISLGQGGEGWSLGLPRRQRTEETVQK